MGIKIDMWDVWGVGMGIRCRLVYSIGHAMGRGLLGEMVCMVYYDIR